MRSLSCALTGGPDPREILGPSYDRRRPPLAPLAPHQPHPARDAAYALERGGVVASQGRVQEGARAAERDSARGVVQLSRSLARV